MSLEKHDSSNEKDNKTHFDRVQELQIAKATSDLVMRRRLCFVVTIVAVFCVLFATGVVTLHGLGKIVLPTYALVALIVVIIGSFPRKLTKIISSYFDENR